MTWTVKRQSLVIVSLNNCLVSVNGQMVAFGVGDHREFRAGERIELIPKPSTSPSFVLVDVARTSQPLTILTEDLAAHQQLDDASDRNQTLLIALDHLQITDEKDAGDESEPWKAGHVDLVALRRGQTAWLIPGIHRIRNSSKAPARFLTIEW
jgi:hypothetical protein